jgi:hypothetical protein
MVARLNGGFLIIIFQHYDLLWDLIQISDVLFCLHGLVASDCGRWPVLWWRFGGGLVLIPLYCRINNVLPTRIMAYGR